MLASLGYPELANVGWCVLNACISDFIGDLVFLLCCLKTLLEL